MRYRNDVIRSVLLRHIRANLGMMLARDYTLCYEVRSTLVMQTSCKNSDNLDLLKRRVRTQSLQLDLRELTRVIH